MGVVNCATMKHSPTEIAVFTAVWVFLSGVIKLHSAEQWALEYADQLSP